MKIILKFDVQIITLITIMTACVPDVRYCCLYVLDQNYIGYLYHIMCTSLHVSNIYYLVETYE